MSQPRAVVFDMDGTLVDSEVVWDQVRGALAEAEGRPYTLENTVAMMGMSTPEWARYCADVLGLAGTPEQIARRVIDGVADAYRTGRVRLLPGAVDAVRRMAAVWPVAVASSSPPELIDAGLDALGVSDLVPVRVSSESVGAGKPRPDVYLEACRRLGVRPEDAVAVEDSSNGIRSAASAGLTLVAVPLEPHVPDAEVLALASVVLPDLERLTPALVTSLWAG